MSGGSYDYLYSRDSDELFGYSGVLEEMADRLAKLGYADAAAQETLWILLEMRAFQNRINTVKDRLRDVWQAVEWWDSCDSNEKCLKEAVKEYNDSRSK